LAVPVEADGRILGVLSLYAPQANMFDETHLRIAQVVAYAAARSNVSLPSAARRHTVETGSHSLETVQ
jgi:GAF domain